MRDASIYLDDILSSNRTNQGTITLQIGELNHQAVNTDGVQVIAPFGLISRPAKAASTASQAACFDIGNKIFCLGARETRNQTTWTVNEGETCLHAQGPNANGQGFLLLQDNGSTSTLTLGTKSGNSSSGQGIKLVLDSNSNFSLTLGSTGTVIKADSSGTVALGPNPSDFVALASKVQTELTKIAASFASLTSPSGPVTGASYVAPGNVAATMVKAV